MQWTITEVSVWLLIQTSTGVINYFCQYYHPIMMRCHAHCWSEHTVYCFYLKPGNNQHNTHSFNNCHGTVCTYYIPQWVRQLRKWKNDHTANKKATPNHFQRPLFLTTYTLEVHFNITLTSLSVSSTWQGIPMDSPPNFLRANFHIRTNVR